MATCSVCGCDTGNHHTLCTDHDIELQGDAGYILAQYLEQNGIPVEDEYLEAPKGFEDRTHSRGKVTEEEMLESFVRVR